MLSVIIPTRNRAESLRLTLQSLQSQILPVDLFEVLVVDNGSMDNTREICASFKNTIRHLRYFFEETPGLHVGRHLGMEMAKSDILVFVDDDIVAAQGWLQAIVSTFSDPAVQLVGGPSVPLYEQAPPEWMEAFWTRTADGKNICGYLSLLDFGDKECEIDPALIWGLNYSIRKGTLIELGGFHPDGFPWELRRFRGDGETALSVEAKRRGLKALYQPGARVHHKIPANRMTVEYFERRAFLQGISDSFTRLRQPPVHKSSDNKRNEIDWLLPIKMIKKRLKKIFAPPTHDIYRDIKIRIGQSHEAGISFHQREVQCDPELLQWVLRNNYLGENGRLPE